MPPLLYKSAFDVTSVTATSSVARPSVPEGDDDVRLAGHTAQDRLESSAVVLFTTTPPSRCVVVVFGTRAKYTRKKKQGKKERNNKFSTAVFATATVVVVVVGENSISRNYIVMIRIGSVRPLRGRPFFYTRFIIIFAETFTTHNTPEKQLLLYFVVRTRIHLLESQNRIRSV